MSTNRTKLFKLATRWSRWFLSLLFHSLSTRIDLYHYLRNRPRTGPTLCVHLHRSNWLAEKIPIEIAIRKEHDFDSSYQQHLLLRLLTLMTSFEFQLFEKFSSLPSIDRLWNGFVLSCGDDFLYMVIMVLVIIETGCGTSSLFDVWLKARQP